MMIKDLFGERGHDFGSEGDEFWMIALGCNYLDRSKVWVEGGTCGI